MHASIDIEKLQWEQPNETWGKKDKRVQRCLIGKSVCFVTTSVEESPKMAMNHVRKPSLLDLGLHERIRDEDCRNCFAPKITAVEALYGIFGRFDSVKLDVNIALNGL